MKYFEHFDVKSIDEAAQLLKKCESARIIAGGSDLIGGLKDDLWEQFPEQVVNLKTISGLKEITVEDGALHIGALVTLTEIERSDVVKSEWFALAEAARRTASPILRSIGTIAGNICQENRCWYYRYPNKLGGRVNCVRKTGKSCFAVLGDHRFHSIFGAVNKCIAVNPSDTAPALMVLDARVQTNKREIPIGGFFSASLGSGSTVLEHDEIVLKIIVPAAPKGRKSKFLKIAYRKSIDFAIVNCAVSLVLENSVVVDSRVCLNAVYNNPVRCEEVEALLKGKTLNEDLTKEAGELAVAKAKSLFQNIYKVQIAKTLVGDTLMACLKTVKNKE